MTMTISDNAAMPSVLTQDLLDHAAARTATYDQENRFFIEDFEELRRAGYLKLAVAARVRRWWIVPRRGCP